jgi:hypothetical protein
MIATQLSVRQILVNARNYLENHHWIKSRYYDKDGGVCLAGAVAIGFNPNYWNDWPNVLVLNKEYSKARETLFDLIYEKTDGDILTLISWNDFVAKNKQEVLDLLDEAIEEWT